MYFSPLLLRFPSQLSAVSPLDGIVTGLVLRMVIFIFTGMLRCFSLSSSSHFLEEDLPRGFGPSSGRIVTEKV